MFGFSDFAEYRRNEQDLNRRAEQSRVARERKETARRKATEQRTAERAAERAAERTAERTRQADAARTARPRVA